jgi:hypothetical protein
MSARHDCFVYCFALRKDCKLLYLLQERNPPRTAVKKKIELLHRENASLQGQGWDG